MHALISTVYLGLTALFFLFTAWSSGVAPEAFARQLGLSVADAGGRNEVRSQYAGFFLAAAVACLLALAGVVSRPAAYGVLAVIFGGLFAGRLASLVLNGGMAGYSPSIRALYVIDGLGAAGAAWLLLARPG